MEDCGDSDDSKALAAALSGVEMKGQAAFRRRPAFLFVTSRQESAMGFGGCESYGGETNHAILQ